MSTTNIDGISAIHCVITDACHKHHGGKGQSFQEAVDRVRKQYFQCLEGWGDTEGVDYHLVLTVDSPRHKKMREDAKPEVTGPELREMIRRSEDDVGS